MVNTIRVLGRGKNGYAKSADQLAEIMLKFTKLNRRKRIMQRNNTENASVMFDWKVLIENYKKAYKMALK